MLDKEESNKPSEIAEHKFGPFVSGDTLNLSRQYLTDEDMRDVIHFIHQYPEITKLDLSLNNIGDKGLNDFSEKNQTITNVNFSGNNISDHGVAVFAYKNLAVKQVNFTYNPISDKGIAQFVEINDMCSSIHFSTMRYH
jgi:Ran GTPase-activating protein (RanGAP) involved in mRNA processing and transport